MVCLSWSTVLFGCASMIKGEGTPVTHYYLLSAMGEKKSGDAVLRRGVRLALEPVEVPDYLARLQLVYRQGDHRLAVDESDLWAEDLDAGLVRVMVENLSRLMDSDSVWRLPMKKPVPYDFRLWVQFIRFELDSDSRVRLAARWKLRGQGDFENKVIGSVTEIRGDRVDVADKEAYVAALSVVLEEFCRRIVAQIPNERREGDAPITGSGDKAASPVATMPAPLPLTIPRPRPVS
ncbi:MAG TPA: membrane integrity-associated transporter subunit PqiC [Magnetococcales bacterium]|nr:membrane integrity-associated transporter subunit PqiC [Magnetococcales bacterium]